MKRSGTIAVNDDNNEDNESLSFLSLSLEDNDKNGFTLHNNKIEIALLLFSYTEFMANNNNDLISP